MDFLVDGADDEAEPAAEGEGETSDTAEGREAEVNDERRGAADAVEPDAPGARGPLPTSDAPAGLPAERPAARVSGESAGWVSTLRG